MTESIHFEGKTQGDICRCKTVVNGMVYEFDAYITDFDFQREDIDYALTFVRSYTVDMKMQVTGPVKTRRARR